MQGGSLYVEAEEKDAEVEEAVRVDEKVVKLGEVMVRFQSRGGGCRGQRKRGGV